MFAIYITGLIVYGIYVVTNLLFTDKLEKAKPMQKEAEEELKKLGIEDTKFWAMFLMMLAVTASVLVWPITLIVKVFSKRNKYS